MFARLGPWCHDRRRLVLGFWIALLVLANAIAAEPDVPSAYWDQIRHPFRPYRPQSVQTPDGWLT